MGMPRMPTSLTFRYRNEVVSQVDFSNRGVRSLGAAMGFYESISSAPSLDTNDLEQLRRAWGTAIEREGWLASKDFADGCSLADARLASGFPWLSNKARQQLVNAASYQWL